MDINAILTRADINLLLARVDVNAMIEQIDIDRVLDRVDLNAVLSRVDIDALMQRTEIGSIIASTGAGIASKVIDVARSEGVGLDFVVQRWTDRIFEAPFLAGTQRAVPARRRAGRVAAMTLLVEPDRDLSLQGHYAGFATRLAAFAIDLVTLLVLFDILGTTVEFVVSTLSGGSWKISDLPVGGGLFLGILAFLYCTYPVAAGGRTFGMAVAGLRVVRPDGSPVGWSQAIIRILALPLSFLTLGFGFLLIVLRRDHRALQDLIGGTAVVYAWDARAARWRFLTKSE